MRHAAIHRFGRLHHARTVPRAGLLAVVLTVVLAAALLGGCDDVSAPATADDAAASLSRAYVQELGGPASNPAFPGYPDTLRAALPYDIDYAYLEKLDLTNPNERALAQRLFDIFAWETFVALQWPHDADGRPARAFDAPGDPQWTRWKASYEVFLADGSTPAPWESPRRVVVGNDTVVLNRADHLLHGTQKSVAVGELDGGEQAFDSGHLWDQNGRLVRYESLMNERLFDDIVQDTLYNVEGQAAYAERFGCASFGWSNPDHAPDPAFAGAMTLKLAWKEMDPAHDRPERYFTRSAYVHAGDRLEERTYGLVGMHVVHKTNSAKNWVWATFEHVDNLSINRVAEAHHALPERPAFYDPACDSCAVNVPPSEDAPRPATQVLRVLAIEEPTTDLNREVRGRLQETGSVWRHYHLVGTQWPLPPNTTCAGADTARVNPVPPHLANAVLETYFQQGNTDVDGRPVFQMSSCMRCHSSAPIATGFDGTAQWGGRLSGDYVWMLSQAHPRSGTVATSSNPRAAAAERP